jgi:hypothetical protein
MIAPYVITAEQASGGRQSFARATAREAITKATELMSAGCKRVRTIDAEGRTYTPSDFAELRNY